MAGTPPLRSDPQEAANDINSVENDITSSSQSLQAQLATALGYLQTAANEASAVTGDNGDSGVAAASVEYNVQHADDAGLRGLTC